MTASPKSDRPLEPWPTCSRRGPRRRSRCTVRPLFFGGGPLRNGHGPAGFRRRHHGDYLRSNPEQASDRSCSRQSGGAPEAEEIIDRLLDKDRSLRYQTAADLEADLRRMKRDSDATRSATSVVSRPAACPGPGRRRADRCFFSPKTKPRDPVGGSWSGRWRRCDSRHVRFVATHARPDRARCHIGR